MTEFPRPQHQWTIWDMIAAKWFEAQVKAGLWQLPDDPFNPADWKADDVYRQHRTVSRRLASGNAG